MRRLAFAIVLFAATAALAACGQKGPLVRPNSGPAPAHSAPQAPAPDLPTPIPDDGGH